MLLTLLKQLVIHLTTLGLILFFTFLLLHLVPGGPFDQERVLPPEIEQNLYERYGLSKRGEQGFWPWFASDVKSYVNYIKKGQLGPSLKFKNRDVREIIGQAFGPSLQLGGLALLLSLGLGIPLGILAGAKAQGFVDRVIFTVASSLVALPNFVIAVCLVLVFSLTLGFLPPALWEGGSYRILPVLTLACMPSAYFIQLTRNGILSQLNADYVRTAKAKGVVFWVILFKHVLKNIASPLLSILGPLTAALVTGSFVVETIFSIPGLGKHFVTAITDRDFFLVMGITILYGGLLILLNWFVDIGYLLLDPRMKKNGMAKS